MLTDAEKKTLLELARSTIAARVMGTSKPSFDGNHGALSADSGAFVTIHNADGSLRGCIGTFASPNPLFKTITDMAVAAAFNDPRFVRLDKTELNGVWIEISVLSPLKEISDVAEIEVGRHGLYIIKGQSRGVLLPQVATECGFDRVEFLRNTCLKAGLRPDAWKEGATIFTFEAEIFREER